MNDEEIKAIKMCRLLLNGDITVHVIDDDGGTAYAGTVNKTYNDDLETVLNLIEKQKERIEYLKRSIDRKEDSLIEEYQNNVELETKLQEKDLEITALKMEHEHDIKMIDEVKGEAVKLYKEIETLKRDFEIVDHECNRLEQEDIRKDMMINLMANHIATSDSDLCEYLDMTTKCKYYAGENKKTCEQCIKEYFENKVKEK